MKEKIRIKKDEESVEISSEFPKLTERFPDWLKVLSKRFLSVLAFAKTKSYVKLKLEYSEMLQFDMRVVIYIIYDKITNILSILYYEKDLETRTEKWHFLHIDIDEEIKKFFFKLNPTLARLLFS